MNPGGTHLKQKWAVIITGRHDAGDYRNIITVPLSAPRDPVRLPHTLVYTNTGTLGKKGNGYLRYQRVIKQEGGGEGREGGKEIVGERNLLSTRQGRYASACAFTFTFAFDGAGAGEFVPVCACSALVNKFCRRPGTTWSGVTGKRCSRRRESRPNKDLKFNGMARVGRDKYCRQGS